jgi:hypothetical protein
MVEKYRRGSNQSVDCERLTTSYENGSNEFDFNNKYVFEQWGFCIAKSSIKSFSVLRTISLPFAAIFTFIAFYQRKFELKMSNRTFFAALASPFTLLFLSGVLITLVQLFVGSSENDLGNRLGLYIVLLPCFVLALGIRRFRKIL